MRTTVANVEATVMKQLDESASGNSPTVLRAVEEAKKIGARTAALLGKGGGRTATVVDRALVVPSNVTPRMQEAVSILEQ